MVEPSPATKGAITEMLVCADLMARGFEVFRALSQTRHSCDLVAIGAGQTLRIEVRTGRIQTPSTGTVTFQRNGTGPFRRLPSDVDHYAVVVDGEVGLYVPPLPGVSQEASA